MHSLNKGKRGEREVAKLLTEITGVVWKRVPCSGALFTSQDSSQFRGDVYTDDPFLKDIVVEVKNQKIEVSLNDVINRDSFVWKWVAQLNSECKVGGLGILFFKNKGKWCWYIKKAGTVENTVFINKLKEVSVQYYDFGVIK